MTSDELVAASTRAVSAGFDGCDDGMVLVPREPTPGMLHFVIGDTHSEGQAYYAAMLAAALAQQAKP